MFGNAELKGRELRMPEVKVRSGESIDKALRRFKRLCREDLKEMKKRKHYEKPSDIRRKQKTRKKGKKTEQQMS